MTTYESTSGSIVHVELYSDDVEATQAFYEETFGWSFEPIEGTEGAGEMGYTVWRAADPPFGGLVGPMEDAPFEPPVTLFYVGVEDLAATGEAIVEAGGELLMEEMPVPGMGVFTVFRDPGGVVEAAWETRYEEASEEEMSRITDEPDEGSITFFELYSEDPDATRAFHEAVFGWEFETVEEGGYTTIRPPTPPYGGVMAATDESPVGTLAYLLVGSAEDAARAIEDAGGSVLREPFDVEGWGTMAVFESPGGVLQAVWENAEGRAESAESASAREERPSAS